MSHTYEKVSSNKVKLTFNIPAEQFDEAMQKAYLQNRGKINVPGFRKGKAPRKMIESLYGESVFYEDAINLILPDAYEAAVKEEELHPVDQPSVDLDWASVGAGKELNFTLEVFVYPDVELGDYKNLTVEVKKDTLTDAMVDARIAQDQNQASRTVEVEDRPVQNGDTVRLDYAGTVDGVAFEGGTAEGQTLTIGSNTFIPGFEEQMIGMNLNEEKDLQVTFPEEYHAKELAGKNAVFHVKVLTISATEKPALDDDFAADISEFDTFEAYKADIVAKLTAQVEKTNDVKVENALVEKAAEVSKVDIPTAMIDDEVDYMVQNMGMRMAYQGLKLEDYLKYTGSTLEKLKESNRGEAEKQVKIQLVMQAIRKAEAVDATEEDVNAVIADTAKEYGEDVEEFTKNLKDEQKANMKDRAVVLNVIKLMKQGATVLEKTEEVKAEEPKAEEAQAE